MEIDMDILDTIAKGIHRTTRIMYKANLDWARTRKHLQSLAERGLIEKHAEAGRNQYYLTNRGVEVLQLFNKFRRVAYQIAVELRRE